MSNQVFSLQLKCIFSAKEEEGLSESEANFKKGLVETFDNSYIRRRYIIPQSRYVPSLCGTHLSLGRVVGSWISESRAQDPGPYPDPPWIQSLPQDMRHEQ
jgi:hypothetical protein